MKLRMKIFEGPDCCGKTTQANLMVDKFDNAILLHFPMLNINPSTSVVGDEYGIYTDDNLFKMDPSMYVPLAIRNLNKTLYSDTFISIDHSDEIYKNMENNILSNAKNKLAFVKYMKKFFNPSNDGNDLKCTPNLSLFENLILRLRLNGEEIKENKFETLLKFRDKFLFNSNNKSDYFYIVLDRFYISGRFYNLEMPLKIFERKLSNIYTSSSAFNEKFNTISTQLRDLYDKDEIKLLDTLREVLVNYNYYFSELSSKCLSVKNVLENFKQSKILPYTQQFIFKSSEYIRSLVMSGNRECDEYDKNLDMVREISALYNSLAMSFDSFKEKDFCHVFDNTNCDNLYVVPNIDSIISALDIEDNKPSNCVLISQIHEKIMKKSSIIDKIKYSIEISIVENNEGSKHNISPKITLGTFEL